MEITNIQVHNNQLIVNIDDMRDDQMVAVRIGGEIRTYSRTPIEFDLAGVKGKKNLLISEVEIVNNQAIQYVSVPLNERLQNQILTYQDNVAEYTFETKERRISLAIEAKPITATIQITRDAVQVTFDQSYSDIKLDLQTRKKNNGVLLEGASQDGRTWIYPWHEWLTTVFAQQSARRIDAFVMFDTPRQANRVRLRANEASNMSALVIDQDSVPTLYQQGIQAYVTQDGDWSLIKNNLPKIRRERMELETVITRIKRVDDTFQLRATMKGLLPADFSIEEAVLVFRNRLSYAEQPVQLTHVEQTATGLTLDMIVDVKEILTPFYWDLYVRVKTNNEQFILQLDRAGKQVQRYVERHKYTREVLVNNEQLFYPYITSIQGNLAFESRPVESFETPENLKRERLAYWTAKLLIPYFKLKQPWIIYEKNTMGAHDNGFHFFKYLYHEQKEVPAYFVINPTSPEYKNLKGMSDRVIDFMSFKYFLYLYGAKLLISSDTKYHVYNMHRRDSLMAKALAKKKNVFLQHGVNGLKQVPGFHKVRGLLDFIIAPSQFEKDTITVPKWGYEPNEVAVTGYARWDSYEDKTAQIPFKQIFMMPTWRKWMDGMSREQFVQTPFYHEYKTFLESPRLKQILAENNVRLAFFLHPYFKDYVDLFGIDASVIDRYGYLDVDMGEEIMKSSMMITDYSSVAWDMFYLKKPVAFYQFDRDDYLKTEGAYLDYERDLFGDATFDAAQTVAVIEKYVMRQFAEEKKYITKRDELLNLVDHNNSARIFDAVKKL